jgi:hypothetical protein
MPIAAPAGRIGPGTAVDQGNQYTRLVLAVFSMHMNA